MACLNCMLGAGLRPGNGQAKLVRASGGLKGLLGCHLGLLKARLGGLSASGLLPQSLLGLLGRPVKRPTGLWRAPRDPFRAF